MISKSSISRVVADRTRCLSIFEFRGEECSEFIDAQRVSRASSCCIDEDEFLVAVFGEGLVKLFRGDNDVDRQVHDFAVDLQLLNGGNSVGIDGNEGNGVGKSAEIMGGDFRQSCRLADAGRTDQGKAVLAFGIAEIRGTDRDEILDGAEEKRMQGGGVFQFSIPRGFPWRNPSWFSPYRDQCRMPADIL